MKIAFDAKRALNNSTGLGNYSRILLNALLRDFPEHEYFLFAPKAKDEFFAQLNGDFKIFFPETNFQKSLHPLWRSFGITKQLEKQRVNIYHGLSNEIPIRNPKSETRNIATIHDLIFLKHTEQYPFFDRQIYEIKTRYAAKHADKIIAVSEETKNDLIEFYGTDERKIEVIYPSVNVLFQNQESRIKSQDVIQKYNLPEKYILNVASFFPRKNQITLIEAFDLIKNKVEENLVLVANVGTIRKKVEELIHRKNLEKRITIIDNILNEDFPEFYRAASVFVFPSLYEGFGMPIVEALFSKTPVITTKNGCFEEAGGKNSLYVNSTSAEEIADAILKVLNNETLRAKMIESGFAHAQTMTDKIIAKKTMRVYQGVK